MRRDIYPHIRKIPPDAWKRKAWPITQNWEEIKPILTGEQARLFETKRHGAKERLPHKDDDEGGNN